MLSRVACLVAGTCLALGASLCGATAVSCAGEDGELFRFVNDAYGETIAFDVIRNGKPVGSHVTTFERADGSLTAVSKLSLKITVLRIPIYKFNYTSQSQWCAGRLRSLEARVSDNGEVSTTSVSAAGERLLIENGADTAEGQPDLLPTDHWNPQVLTRTEVINTITGRINRVTITPCREDSSIVKAAAPTGRCFEYSGDLQTRVWYDESDRWVGLEFNGADGSAITYVCRNCRREPL